MKTSNIQYRIAIGKVENGEWKFDHYATENELTSLKPHTDGKIYMRSVTNRWKQEGFMYDSPYCSTISLFSGWQDVSDTHMVEWGCCYNGMELYENDVVTAPYYPLQDDGKYNYHGLIYYDKDSLLFGLGYMLVDKSKRGISDGIGNQLSEYDELILLGNIHENPELLEARND